MIITERLEFGLAQKKLYSSWLIESEDTSEALKEVEKFISHNLLSGNENLNNHPDYCFITKETEGATNTKNISVEQIRKLQEFLGKTSVVSGYKIAVIYDADLMNLNAANACLKILEEPTKNSYIFLITTRLASILATIRSRCFKINVKNADSLNSFVKQNTYIKCISSVAGYIDLNTHLAFINQFATKDRELWLEFVASILYLMNKLIKRAININVDLTDLEDKIFNNLRFKSPSYLLDKFANIKRLMHNTIDYDLDLKTSYVLVANELIN